MAEISARQMELIEAAGKILTNSGVGGLTIKNLAKEMGFSESAVYRHFSSKEAIIVAMLNFLAASIDENLSKISGGTGNALEKLQKLFKRQFGFFSSNRHFIVAGFSDGLMETSPDINQAMFGVMSSKMRHLKKIIAEGQQNGEITKEIPENELVMILLGSFRFQMFRWRMSGFEYDIEIQGNSVIESLLTLIKTK